MMISVETLRSWFYGDRPGESNVALLDDEEANTSTEPLHDDDIEKPQEKKFKWRPADLQQVFWALLPSVIARAFGHTDSDTVITSADTTSYLTGLRGLAALVVVFMHNTDDYMFVHNGWGQTPDDNYIIQLPFVRIIHCGIFGVCIFFVISGFALTYSPLKKAHNGLVDAAIGALPSSVFRRPIRLFLPIVPVLALTIAMIYFQLAYSPNSPEPSPPVAIGFWGHIVFGWKTFVTIVTESTAGTVMPHAWTLSVEFKGSLLVFLCCLGLARVSPLARIPILFALLVFIWNLGGLMYQPCLFLWGMILADARHTRQKLPSLSGAPRKAVAAAFWALFFFALFVGGWPIHGDAYKAMGYSWFANVPLSGIDANRFFPSIAAMMLVTALENLPILQRALNARWILYLGDISFGMYLVHWLAGKCFLTWGLKYQMLRAGYTMAIAWTTTLIITVMLAVWVGDIHWRLVDRKSIRFSHWLGKRLGI